MDQWQDCGLWSGFWLWWYLELFQEQGCDAFLFDDFCLWGEGTEGGVGGGFFDEVWLRGVFFVLFFVLFEVGAGDLEAVEEECGSAGVEVVGGDAGEDFADGELDGGAVFGRGEFEGGGAGAAGFEVGDGSAGGVVVVAEFFAAEGGAGAAVSGGEDVAALVAFWCWIEFVHGDGPLPGFWCKVFE